MSQQPIPAEACTELGADGSPIKLSPWLRLRVALLRWHLTCLIDERNHYAALGWIGPLYLRQSYAEQRRLMSRIAQLHVAALTAAKPARSWRTAGTALIATCGAGALVLAACGGGGSDEEQPAPRPIPDCAKAPELCK